MIVNSAVMTFPAEVFDNEGGSLTADMSRLEQVIDDNDFFPDRAKPYVLAALFADVPLNKQRHGFRIAGFHYPVLFEITEVNYEDRSIQAWTLEPTVEAVRDRPELRKISCIVFNR